MQKANSVSHHPYIKLGQMHIRNETETIYILTSCLSSFEWYFVKAKSRQHNVAAHKSFLYISSLLECNLPTEDVICMT